VYTDARPPYGCLGLTLTRSDSRQKIRRILLNS
jgi:hypothetical protein